MRTPLRGLHAKLCSLSSTMRTRESGSRNSLKFFTYTARGLRRLSPGASTRPAALALSLLELSDGRRRSQWALCLMDSKCTPAFISRLCAIVFAYLSSAAVKMARRKCFAARCRKDTRPGRMSTATRRLSCLMTKSPSPQAPPTQSVATSVLSRSNASSGFAGAAVVHACPRAPASLYDEARARRAPNVCGDDAPLGGPAGGNRDDGDPGSIDPPGERASTDGDRRASCERWLDASGELPPSGIGGDALRRIASGVGGPARNGRPTWNGPSTSASGSTDGDRAP
mmetsp:Transcript_30102/g.92872  ORF Transcript_30102/g.92872 Transcript_30102/m.92872 type:complete len:284 (+) Transcript_30102:1144-1995(+)